MAWRDILAALGLLAGCSWYGWLTAELPERSLPNTPGPSFFPWVIVSMAAVLSVAMLIRAAAALHKSVSADPADGTVPRLGIALLAVFLAYLAILPVAGFVLPSVAFFAVLMLLYGSRNPWLISAVSVAVPAVLFVLFRHGLQIVLPSGLAGF